MATIYCQLVLFMLGAVLIVTGTTDQRSRRSGSASVNNEGKIDTRVHQESGSDKDSSSEGENSSENSSSGASSSSEGSNGTEASNSSSGDTGDGDSFKGLKNNETNEYDATYWKSWLSTETSATEEDARACGNIEDRYCFNAPYKCTDIGGLLDDDYDCDEHMFCCDLSGAE